jgi:hypothetical protein
LKIPVHKTIREALRLGGKTLACDAVLLIGVHGDYPVNKLGQIGYALSVFGGLPTRKERVSRPCRELPWHRD